MDSKMLSTEKALAIVKREAKILFQQQGAVEQLRLDSEAEVVGRVLAEDLRAPADVPGFYNSAMDGYVLHTEDVRYGASSPPGSSEPIPIVGEVAAGELPQLLPPGGCLRIFTGAPVPEYGNVIVPKEDCIVENGSILIRGPRPSEGKHIRAKDLVFSAGALICPRGRSINAELLSVLASAGIVELPVYRRVRIALCITGDELVSPGEPLQCGQIYDSNQILLRQLCQSFHCELLAVVRLKDDYEQTKEKLLELSGQADCLICSGGISVGDRDYIQKFMSEEAEIRIHKVAIKPGKPFSFGLLANKGWSCPVFCLPGNPLSAYICFQYFVIPFLKLRQGHSDYPHRFLVVKAPEDLPVNARTQFLFASYDWNSGRISICAEQSSAALQNLVNANGALFVEAGRQVSMGQDLPFLFFS